MIKSLGSALVLASFWALPATAAPEASGPKAVVAPAAATDRKDTVPAWMLRPFKALPGTSGHAAPSAAPVTLGRKLFFDRRLSADGKVSCNSCHDLAAFGVDGQRVSTGVYGRQGRRNAPSVFNAGSYLSQFWDGRADTLEAQAEGPLTHPDEMALTPGQVMARVKEDAAYRPLFVAAFPDDPDPLSFSNALRAIATFERQLRTPGRFDRFLGGESEALSSTERKGLRLFVEVGCATCHTGTTLGGSTIEKLGVVEEYPDTADLGRFEVTRQPADRMRFRVPSLRNVARTGPYFHNGSVSNLRTAVQSMGRYQLGTQLGDGDVELLVAFLSALTGEPQGVATAANP